MEVRRLLADLRNLSNGVLYYPLLIAFTWLTYNSVYSLSDDEDLKVVAPLLALFTGSLMSIAAERQDKVADRIAIEFGGPRARLKLRMVSLMLANSILVSLGLLVAVLQNGTMGSSPARTLATAFLVILVVSTLGTLIASFIPHAIVALVITFFLLSWGGSDPENNWGLSHLLQLLREANPINWAKAAFEFTAPWLLFGAALWASSHCRQFCFKWPPRMPNLAPAKSLNPPRWLNEKRNFTKIAIRAGLTNPLPLLALVVCLGLYSFGTINLAAKLSTFNPDVTLFAALPGILFSNVIPALILAGTSQRRDAVEQESLLYGSQRKSLTAQVLQQNSIIASTIIGFIAILASLMNVHLFDQTVIRSCLWALILSPGFATIGVYLNRVIRLPLVSGLISYLITLPEIFLAKFFPEVRPFLPSSLFSILAGGESGYTQHFSPTAVVFAYLLGITLTILPITLLATQPRKVIS